MLGFIFGRILFKFKFYLFLIAVGWYINETGLTQSILNSGIKFAQSSLSEVVTLAGQALKNH